ncbi:MAG: DUF2071 domain-containing protein, partial [Bacteroidota bacterium]
MPQTFLRAQWLNLIMANYEIDPSVLQPLLPYGTELDSWEGRHYVSLVGFLFYDTRVLGVPIPWHRTFEEVNLRFYVKRGDKRGVVFVKEIVPKPAISFVANTLYGEHYVTRKMSHHWQIEAERRQIEYAWQSKSGRHHLKVLAEGKAQPLEEGSEAAFITEHYWGYTRLAERKTGEYRVAHPSWDVFSVSQYDIQLDVAEVYGAAFLPALSIEPIS